MLLGAFMLMMACTPFSLKSGKGVISRSVEGGVRSENTQSGELAAQVSALDSTLQGDLTPHSTLLTPRIDSLIPRDSALDSTLQGNLLSPSSCLLPRDSTLVPRNVQGITVDSLARSLSPSTTLKEAAAKLKRDTTTMDSLELAIYWPSISITRPSTTLWHSTASTAAEREVSTRPWNILPTTR